MNHFLLKMGISTTFYHTLPLSLKILSGIILYSILIKFRTENLVNPSIYWA